MFRVRSANPHFIFMSIMKIPLTLAELFPESALSCRTLCGSHLLWRSEHSGRNNPSEDWGCFVDVSYWTLALLPQGTPLCHNYYPFLEMFTLSAYNFSLYKGKGKICKQTWASISENYWILKIHPNVLLNRQLPTFLSLPWALLAEVFPGSVWDLPTRRFLFCMWKKRGLFLVLFLLILW